MVEDDLLQKPLIHKVETLLKSRLFTIESVKLEFSNGKKREYERLCFSKCETVMVIPVIEDQLLLIREYGVGIESYELGFPKGLLNVGENILEAADRELMEEIGFSAHSFVLLNSVIIAPSYLSSTTNIVLARKLYPKILQGDEPETLQLVYWPINRILDLLNEPDFREARSISALFFLYVWLSERH